MKRLIKSETCSFVSKQNKNPLCLVLYHSPVGIKAIKVKKFSNFHLHQLEQFFILDQIALVEKDHQSGHTHLPKVERKGAVLYVNPGSAGPRRFSLPVTVAHIRVHGGSLDADIVELDAAGTEAE